MRKVKRGPLVEFSRREIIQALCNEYNHLFKDAYDPAIDLSLEQYQSEMEAKTLEELIKETSTDHEFYTLDDFMKRYGWLKHGIGLACIRERPHICHFQKIDAPTALFGRGWDGHQPFDHSFIAVAVFCTMNSCSLDLEDSTDAGTSHQSR